MHPEERERLENELRMNNFVSVGDVPYTTTQLALLNWHKLDALEKTLVIRLDQLEHAKLNVSDFENHRDRLMKMVGFVIGFVTITVSIVAIVATVQ